MHGLLGEQHEDRAADVAATGPAVSAAPSATWPSLRTAFASESSAAAPAEARAAALELTVGKVSAVVVVVPVFVLVFVLVFGLVTVMVVLHVVLLAVNRTIACVSRNAHDISRLYRRQLRGPALASRHARRLRRPPVARRPALGP